MQAELSDLPGAWRIYGSDHFPSGRNYYVEFRVPAGKAKAALLAALEKIT